MHGKPITFRNPFPSFYNNVACFILLTLTPVFVLSQTTIFNETLRGGSIPAGWSQVDVSFQTAAGGYARLDENNASLTTPTFDASSFDSLEVGFDVAKWGSGGDGPITVEYSLDSGSNWSVAGTSNTPTGSTYLSGTITVSAVSSTMQIRFTRPTSPSRKRLRDVEIDGVGVGGAPNPEPSNHATSFTAVAGGAFQIDLTWNDNDGPDAADGFLILGKTGGGTYAGVTDGTQVADDSDWSDDNFAVNVNSGVETVNITGLNQSTAYDFVIYPYSNLGSNIDYKTDGTIPGASATTSAWVVPQLVITEVADPKDEYQGRFVEVMNNGSSAIDLDAEDIYFARQANGGNIASIKLTGTLAAGDILIIGNSSNLTPRYGYPADVDFGSVTGNGDDGYFLYLGGDETTGTMMDAYGVLNVDGTGEAWEYEDARAVRNNPKTVSPNTTWTASEWTIQDPADLADMTPGALENEFRYDGVWKPSDAYVNSSSSDDVLIIGNLSTTSNIDADNFEVRPGTSFTISSGNGISISGIIKNEGTITVENNASIVQNQSANANTGSGTYIVKRQGSTAPLAYNAWSSPVEDVWIHDNSGVFSSDNPCDLFVYDTPSDNWKYDFPVGYNASCNSNSVTFNSNVTVSGADGKMTPGRGYFAPGATGSGVREFTGSDIHNGDISYSLESGSGDDWNLVGNPYPSAIGINEFLSENSSLGAVYIWDDDNSEGASYASADYITFNTSGATTGGGGRTINSNNISSCQGFFVNGNGTLNFKNNMRKSQDNNEFRSGTPTSISRFWLGLQGDSAYSDILVAFRSRATSGFDIAYDAPKRYGQHDLNVSALIEEEGEMAILGEPFIFFDESRTVPLAVQSSKSGDFQFRMKNPENIPDDLKILLVDKVEQEFYDLRTEAVSIHLQNEKDSSRFELFLSRKAEAFDGSTGNDLGFVPTGTPEIEAETEVDFFRSSGGRLHINTNNGVRIREVEFFNSAGRRFEIPITGKNSDAMICNPSRLSSGIYFVIVKLDDGKTATHKFHNQSK